MEMETWKHRDIDIETWKHREMEAWRHGHEDVETSNGKRKMEHGSSGDFP
jgi:hypothetical protein